MNPPWRLLYMVSHPIQYQAPLLRLTATDPDIELTVLFESMKTAGSYVDAGFGRDVAWDVPLTDGYEHHEVSGLGQVGNHLGAADALWVHGWDSVLRRSSIKLATEMKVPVLMRGENTAVAMPDGWALRGILKRWYLTRIFANCAGFLCIGSDNREYYAARGVASDRLFSMPYAVDNDFFISRAKEAAKRRDHFRDDLGLKPGRPVVLYAGKLQGRKHPVTLLRAWQALPEEVKPYLLYVGDGEERAALEKAASNDPLIQVLGFRNQTELPAFYDIADIFVLAGEREPWGLAINEAMAAGTAVIASDQCGAAADLVDETSGSVVPAGDTSALAMAMQRMLVDEEGLNAMKSAGIRKITTWDFQADIIGLKKAIRAVCPAPLQA